MGTTVFTKPVVVVTGAANGIGWATSRQFAQQGWTVALLDLRAEEVVQRANTLGEGHMAWACDVTDQAGVEATVGEVFQRWGQVDALVNNAGVGDQALPTLDQSIDSFDRVLSVHLRGCFLMTQHVLRHMHRQARDARGNRGAVVNLSSIAGLGGIPSRNAYSAAKAGVLGMTRALASEWARSGIRVNAVAPGYVATAMVSALAQKGAIDGQAVAARTPMGRMADPAEIAEAIVFLASPASSYITGACLPVDGGWSAFGAPELSLGPL